MPETLLYDSMLLPSVQALLLWCLLVPGFFEWYGATFAMLILLTPVGSPAVTGQWVPSQYERIFTIASDVTDAVALMEPRSCCSPTSSGGPGRSPWTATELLVFLPLTAA